MNGSTQNASWWLPPPENPLLREAPVRTSSEPALIISHRQRLIRKLSDKFLSVKLTNSLYI